MAKQQTLLPPLKLALAGYGTVGTGLARILLESQENIMARTGRSIEIVTIFVRDTKKKRAYAIPKGAEITDKQDALFADNIDVVVELMGGIDIARQVIERALKAGKHVVTANKALLAESGNELFTLAAKQKVHLAYEASVCGGIPIVQTLREGLVANTVLSLMGILNGTSNYILSEMTSKKLPYAQVLKEAQDLGYAEADPTFDVEGIDAAHKLVLLIRLAWGIDYPFKKISVRGVSKVTPEDIEYAGEFGYVIKLIGQAFFNNGSLQAGVFPTLVHKSFLLSQVNGAFNAVRVEGDAVGSIFLHGRGAGDLPTGSAVAADIFAIAREAKPNNTGFVTGATPPKVALLASSEAESPYYIRLQLPDAPGVLRDVAQIMADNDISVAQAIQRGEAGKFYVKERKNAPSVPLIIMTHIAKTKAVEKALKTLVASKLLHEEPVYYKVLLREDN